MDTGLVILLSVVVLAAAAVLIFMLRHGRGAGGGGRQGAELAGRLDQMAGSQAGTLAEMLARLQAQEGALAKLLEERLDQVASRVNDTLEKTAKAQSTSHRMRAKCKPIARSEKYLRRTGPFYRANLSSISWS